MILHIPCGSPNEANEIVTGQDLTDFINNQQAGSGIQIIQPCDNDELFDAWGG